MGAATAKRVRLREEVRGAFTRPLRVDRERAVVEGVKVLGWNSSNRRRYLREAAEKAIRQRLYEGVKVYFNHVRGKEQRDAKDLIGKLSGAHVKDDGIYANLHLNPGHPMCEAVMADAERGLGLYGLSHDADAGDYDYQDGNQIVKEIAKVHSVDLVAEAATNSSLSEGIMPLTTLKRVLEARSANPKLPGNARRCMLELLEQYGDDMDTMNLEQEPDADDAGGGMMDGRNLLAQAVAALMQSGDGSDHDLATKVLKLLKPAEAAPEEEEPDEDDMSDDTLGKEGKQPRRPSVPAEAVLTEAMARDWCDLVGVKAEVHLVEGLTGLPESKALKVLRTLKAAQKVQENITRTPRSQEARRTQGAGGTAPLSKLPTSPAKLREWARRN